MRRTLLAAVLIALASPQAWPQSEVAPSTPPECQQLLTIRAELEKHAQAIRDANEKRASVQIACKLFRTYLAVEARIMKAIDAHGAQCGVPPDAAQQFKASHAKASRIGTYVCEAAGTVLDEQRRPVGDFWRRDELDRHFGRGSFEGR